MVQLSLAALASALLATLRLVSAAPTEIFIRAWPQGNVTCGSAVYTVDQIKAATSAGFEHVDNPIGSNSYPHKFNNYEGLPLYCSGESAYQEWPIVRSGIYNGGSPGADRIVFSDNGVYCATVTHTGASGNNFVSCQGD